MSLRSVVRDNALTLVMTGLFLVSIVGQGVAGLAAHNEEQREHGLPEDSMGAFLRSGDFLEAVFENWESEFLQMALYVVLTAVFVQRGAAESRKPEGEERDAEESAPQQAKRPDSPGPVHQGGLALKLYSHSLALALVALFVLSFCLHAVTGLKKENEERAEHGGPPETLVRYVTGGEFWFESFQNWQSEFLSVGALVVLSIFLREKGSPESKPVTAPHRETGGA